jgi:membrane protein YdbS with pleckstrin-like domain
MFWALLAAIAASLGLFQFGSLHVWVQILGMTIKVLLALVALGIVGIIGYVVWKNGNAIWRKRGNAKGLSDDKS